MNMVQHVAERVTDAETRRQASALVHAARYLMLSKGDGYKAEKLAANARAFPQIQAMVKAAVAAGSTGGWGQNLAQFDSEISGFISSLRNFGAFDLVSEFMLQVPIRTRVALVTQGVTPGVIGEGAAKVISKLTLSGISIAETKVAAFIIASDELLRNAVASARLLGDELRRGLAVQTDQTFLQKIGSGIAPSTASGTSAAAILTDLETALDSMTFASNAKLFAVAPALVCKGIRTKATTTGEIAFPGALSGDPLGLVTLVASDGAASGTMTIFDATQLAGDPGIVQLAESNHATVQMDSAPDSPPTGSTVLVNLWQNNLSAILAERIFAIERPSATSVAVIQSINY